MKKYVIGGFGIALSVFIIWYIAHNYDIASSWGIIKQTPLYIIICMVLVYLSSFIFRTIRWKYMFQNHSELSYSHVFKSIILGFAGNNVLPARGGELVRMEYFSRKTSIPRITSLSSIMVEKIIDAGILLLFLAIVRFFIPTEKQIITDTLTLVSFIIIPFLLALIIIRIFGAKISSWLECHSNGLIQKIKPLFDNFYTSILFFKLDKKVLFILLLSFAIWICEGIVFIIAMYGMIPEVSNQAIVIGILALTIVNFAIIVPSSPGYIGVFQAAIMIALTAFGIQESQSFAVAVVVHASQFFPITLLGASIVIYNRIKRGKTK